MSVYIPVFDYKQQRTQNKHQPFFTHRQMFKYHSIGATVLDCTHDLD